MTVEGKALGGRGAGSVGESSPGRASAWGAGRNATKRRKRRFFQGRGVATKKRHCPDRPRGTRRDGRSRHESASGAGVARRVVLLPIPAAPGRGAALGTQSAGRSPRVAALMAHFGIVREAVSECQLNGTIPELPTSGIVLVSGPSGSGKSSALAVLAARYPAARRVDQTVLQASDALIDQVAPWSDLAHAAGLLTTCGLGEPRMWLRSPGTFSDGERFRAQLAIAVALHEREKSGAPLICDEFAAVLHRRLARAIAFNLHKLAVRRKLLMVLATSQEDVAAELRPQLTIRMQGRDRQADIGLTHQSGIGVVALRRRLRIEAGTKRDYEQFAAMHYRRSDELGFVDKVFVLREGRGGELLGIIVYAHAPLELALRNEATGGYFRGRADRVNGELRTIRRVVIHPDVRGCGLGHWLVRRTLPLAGTAFVEAQTSLGEFNPVFERAGMRRVGQVALGPRRRALLKELKRLDADPGDADFVARACRDARLRRVALKAVERWYAATTGGGRGRVIHQSPEMRARLFRGIVATRPVYYLWGNVHHRVTENTEKEL